MPTYEYICDACDHAFERFQSMSADPVKVCPACGRRKVRRKIGAGAGIIFKGGGFYETDYRGEAYKKAADADKTGGEAKSDAKSDAATGEARPAETKPAPAEKPAAKKEPAKASKARITKKN